MQTAATNNLLFTGLSSLLPTRNARARIGNSGLYQLVIEVAHSESLLRLTGTRLVVLAEQAQAFRRTDVLEAVSEALLSMPGSRDLESIGSFYRGLCIQRSGNLDESARLLEEVAQHGPTLYRMRALISLGANSIAREDYVTALSFYYDALRFAERGRIVEYAAAVRAHNDISLINSLDGNHAESLSVLNSILPIARALRTTHPHIYLDYLNNLAVELSEADRFEEARHACNLTLASPLASAYPEWHETRDEIEIRRRSRVSRTSVAVGQQFSSHNNAGVRSTQAPDLEAPRDPPAIPWPKTPSGGAGGNLVQMPLPEPRGEPFLPFDESNGRGRVLEFSSRTRLLEDDQWEDESDLSESRKTIADKLYEMFMAAIDGVEFDQGLVETLYRDYLSRRMNDY